MRTANLKRRLLSACVVGILALASYQPAVAAEAMRNVSKEISDLRSTITFAEVYTVPASLSFRHRLREDDVVSMGCTYKIVDMNDVSSLADILTQADIVQRPEDKRARDVRTVIYLHTQEGQRLSFVLTQEFSDAPVSGVYNGTLPVVAKMGFGADLIRWKHQRVPVSGGSLACGDEHNLKLY